MLILCPVSSNVMVCAVLMQTNHSQRYLFFGEVTSTLGVQMGFAMQAA